MKKIIALGMLASLLNAGLINAQDAATPAPNAADTNATVVAPAPNVADTNAVSIVDTNAADTNAVAAAAPAPKPPEDPVKNLIARFSFDTGIAPESVIGGFEIPVTFQRGSPAMLNGQEIGANKPRLAAGKFGQGLLLESAHVNLYSASQAGAEEASMFQPLNGSTLTGSAEQPWEGKQALAVTTKGEAADEGMAIELKADKALYNGSSIVQAYYVASVYLKGQGNLKIFLKDLDGDKSGEPVYVDLGSEWKRFTCTFTAPFPAKGVGAKHEADWKTLLPPGTNIEMRLQLAIVTTDSSKNTFYADGLQLEAREMPYARTGAGPAPHVWVPGGMVVSNETLTIGTKTNYFANWHTNGTISFWFLPNWDAHDGTQDTIFQVTKNLMTFQHVNGKIQLSPAGTAFTPSDWQNIWHHIVITWNADGQWMMYMDGLDYPGDETALRPLGAAIDLIFGNIALPPTAPDGMIDDLMLFQIALNFDQVKALYAGELLKPGETPASPAAPAAPAPASAAEAAATTPIAATNEPAKDAAPKTESAAPGPAATEAAAPAAAVSNAPATPAE